MPFSDSLQLENRSHVIVWLRENYKHAATTSVSKRSVFAHYMEVCRKQNVATPISHTYFGKLVRKAFPDVRCNRKGPRGSAQQHYRLIRVDGGTSEITSDLFPEDEEVLPQKRSHKKGANKDKNYTPSSTSSATDSRKSVSRAAAAAAASTISRIVDSETSSHPHEEAWSFGSAPSSPFSIPGAHSFPSSPNDSSDYEEDDEYGEDSHEEPHDAEDPRSEYEEDDDDEDKEEQSGDADYENENDGEDEDDQDVDNINLDAALDFDQIPRFYPGDESPGASFSYDVMPAHLSTTTTTTTTMTTSFPQQTFPQFSSYDHPQNPYFVPQQTTATSCSAPLAAYLDDFASFDLDTPLSALNQVNLVEDFGWTTVSANSEARFTAAHSHPAETYVAQPLLTSGVESGGWHY